MCCCSNCKNKVVEYKTNQEKIKELKNLLHAVKYFPVQIEFHDEFCSFVSQDGINIKIEELKCKDM